MRPADSSYHGLIRERVSDDPVGRFSGSFQKPLLKGRIAFAVPCGGIVKLIQSSLGELDPTHAGFGLFRFMARRWSSSNAFSPGISVSLGRFCTRRSSSAFTSSAGRRPTFLGVIACVHRWSPAPIISLFARTAQAPG
jgi:hypothetical protein